METLTLELTKDRLNKVEAKLRSYGLDSLDIVELELFVEMIFQTRIPELVVAKDSGWIKVRGKHYCEECHRCGDNDELILGDGTVITEDEEDWQ